MKWWNSLILGDALVASFNEMELAQVIFIDLVHSAGVATVVSCSVREVQR